MGNLLDLGVALAAGKRTKMDAFLQSWLCSLVASRGNQYSSTGHLRVPWERRTVS